MLHYIEDELISIAMALQGGLHGWCECKTCARWQWLHRLVDKNSYIRDQYALEKRERCFDVYTFSDKWDEIHEKNRSTLRYRFGNWLEQTASRLT